MQYFEFDNRQKAVDLISRIDSALGYPNAVTKTYTYCDLITHKDGGKWAVLKDYITEIYSNNDHIAVINDITTYYAI